MRKLLQDTAQVFQRNNQRIDYDYFDFHLNCKKGGFNLLDAYINDMIKNLYLRDMGYYSEKHTLYTNSTG
jgi:hypothetical protein